MLCTKKLDLIRKIAAKLSGNSKPKCRPFGSVKTEHEDFQTVTETDIDEFNLSSNYENKENPSNKAQFNQPTPTPPAKTNSTMSGLLAAKLQCDEWGLGGVRQKGPLAIPGPIVRKIKPAYSLPALNGPASILRREELHPSYKVDAPRSRNMKERREASENRRKYHSFYSLYRIDEIDEKGID